MDAGADVNARESEPGFSPLHSAACSNRDAAAVTAAVQTLVAAGADVRARSTTGLEPLHLAVYNKNAAAASAAVKTLVEAGANVRAKNNIGLEPLHGAAANPCTEAAAAAVQALMDAGADLNASAADGPRPLHCTAGRLPTALLLVRLGTSLSLRDNVGRTTLEVASGGNAAAEAALHQASISERRCACCGAGGERLKRCIRCRAVSYCG